MSYSFSERLNFSRGKRQQTDLKTLIKMINGATKVQKTDEETDRAGADYIVTLSGGAQITVDAKARDSGIKKYWKHGPEVALEIWSDVDRKVCGWTLNESKDTDLILFTFDKQDTQECWLISFQLLRIAFSNNFGQWVEKYRVATQNSDFNGRTWRSRCVFVPITEVEYAIRQASRSYLATEDDW